MTRSTAVMALVTLALLAGVSAKIPTHTICQKLCPDCTTPDCKCDDVSEIVPLPLPPLPHAQNTIQLPWCAGSTYWQAQRSPRIGAIESGVATDS
jgi:hypothetical protein